MRTASRMAASSVHVFGTQLVEGEHPDRRGCCGWYLAGKKGSQDLLMGGGMLEPQFVHGSARRRAGEAVEAAVGGSDGSLWNSAACLATRTK